MAIIWSLAGVGVVSEVLLSGRAVKIGQVVIYLAMGWACAFDFSSLKAALPEPGLDMLVAGGAAYSIGVVFYVLDKAKKLTHAHGIWHFFVLAGSICHFVSIIAYVR
jgi:hemolysin III